MLYSFTYNTTHVLYSCVVLMSLSCVVLVSLSCVVLIHIQHHSCVVLIHIQHSECLRKYTYGVATVSRIDKIIGLFCRISSLLEGSFAKETYNFIDPTSQSQPIVLAGNPLRADACVCGVWRLVCGMWCVVWAYLRFARVC